jgi:hypothetical protein
MSQGATASQTDEPDKTVTVEMKRQKMLGMKPKDA